MFNFNKNVENLEKNIKHLTTENFLAARMFTRNQFFLSKHSNTDVI